MSGWQDVTSYSQNDTAREPRSWEFGAGAVRVIVTRQHGIPGVWFLRCDGVGFACHTLTQAKIDDAKAEALGLVKNRLLVACRALGGES